MAEEYGQELVKEVVDPNKVETDPAKMKCW
jgi:hypothetical protein